MVLKTLLRQPRIAGPEHPLCPLVHGSVGDHVDRRYAKTATTSCRRSWGGWLRGMLGGGVVARVWPSPHGRMAVA